MFALALQRQVAKARARIQENKQKERKRSNQDIIDEKSRYDRNKTRAAQERADLKRHD